MRLSKTHTAASSKVHGNTGEKDEHLAVLPSLRGRSISLKLCPEDNTKMVGVSGHKRVSSQPLPHPKYSHISHLDTMTES